MENRPRSPGSQASFRSDFTGHELNTVRYWWVNQNQTYRHEVPGGYLWSPVRRSDGARNYFYDTMTQVSPGDVVFSFADTFIRAVGIVTGSAEPSVKPDFGAAGENWSQYGWLVQVEFQELTSPLHPKSHMSTLEPLLPDKYAPLQANGNGLQGVYLTELPTNLATALQSLIGSQFTLVSEELVDLQVPDSAAELELEALIGRIDISATERKQLVNARSGQGLFKNNVRLNENHCRITGVRELHHLRASHIKPWRASDDIEKLHGCNGLLLAPHIDHLFDRGFISFESSGHLVVSPRMETNVLNAWSISIPKNVGTFNVDQRYFLEFHREKILLK